MMMGFEQQMSDVESDCFINWDTYTAHLDKNNYNMGHPRLLFLLFSVFSNKLILQ